MKERVVFKNGALTPSDDLKKELNLKEGESYQLIVPYENYILLKRESKKEDGRVAFVGEIGGLSISDLFSILNMTQKTGVLHLVSDKVKKSVYFRRGEIVFASSSQPEERLGYILYRTGKISMEQLKQAEAQVDNKTRFGGILLKNKFITPKDLWWGVKYQLEEIIYSIFSFTEGTFLFIEGDFLPPDLTRLSLNTQNILMEGFRRLDEWKLIKELIPSGDAYVTMTDEPITVELTPAFQKILACIEGKISVNEIVRRSQLGEFNTYKLLYQLLKTRVVKVVDKEEKKGDDAGIQRMRAAVDKYNNLYRYIIDKIHTVVPGYKFVEPLSSFFDELSDKQKKIFNEVQINSSGELDAEHIIKNLRRMQLVESDNLSKIAGFSELMLTQFLLEGLNELLNFYIFTARQILTENDGEELVRIVKELQQSGEKK